MSKTSDLSYLVGIDLGTTNSVLAYQAQAIEQPALEEPEKIDILPIPQLVKAGQVEERFLLPSFLYLPSDHERTKNAFDLPWEKNGLYLVGEYAKKRGAEVPNRLVSSAKSWLSHKGIDRKKALLPFKASEDIPQLSPIEASTRYLQHLKESWKYRLKQDLTDQEIYLTVPASFDAVAREFTLVATQQAGLSVSLLEEPQAAFYAWLSVHENDWRQILELNDLVLVVDVGGGTTDFSLFSIQEEQGNLHFQRVAVGDHILLGGDNMDIALAHILSQKLSKAKLDAWQSMTLWHQCREAKEALLNDPNLKKYPLSLLGRGSSVIGSTLKTELTLAEIESTLLEGFFPRISSKEYGTPARKVGLSELHLPYADEPAITKQIARFLHTFHQSTSTTSLPTAILFNGGVFKAKMFRDRIVEVLNSWRKTEKKSPLKVLEHQDLDRSVALGAVYYGRTKKGKGIRIRGGTAHSYYVGIESSRPAIPGIPAPLKALCVVPYGMEEGTETAIPQSEFGLIVGEAATFPFFSSNRRKKDEVGTLLDADHADLEENIPLEVTLEITPEDPEGTQIPVKLQSKLTEIGTLEMACVRLDEKQRWRLEFNIRGSEKTKKE
jgi:molecular chaperone DnaK (HSP70)